jgi:hypothetical protein
MMHIQTLIKSVLFFGAMFLIFVPVMAQGAPPATPIDGGLSLLLAAGGIYGIKKLKDRNK